MKLKHEASVMIFKCN